MDPWLYIATIVGTCIICFIVADFVIDLKEQQIEQLQRDNVSLTEALDLALEHNNAEFDEALEVLTQHGLLTEAQN